MAKEPEISVTLVLNNVTGETASFNLVPPPRGPNAPEHAPPVAGAHVALMIHDTQLLGHLAVGDVFDVTFTRLGARGAVAPTPKPPAPDTDQKKGK